MLARWGVPSFFLLSALAAQASIFDFSSVPLKSGITSASTTSGGVTLTVTRQGGIAFDIISLGGAGPSTWDSSVLSPFSNQTANTGFIFDFSTVMAMFSVELGDGGVDSDTWTLQAYSGHNGTGTLLYTVTGNWGTSDFLVTAPQVAKVVGDGFLSLVFNGGSVTAPESLFLDHIQATPSPEPGTVLLTLSGFAALAFAARRKGRS